MRRLILTTVTAIGCLGLLLAVPPVSAQSEVLMTPKASKDDYLTTLRGLRRQPARPATTSTTTTGAPPEGMAMPIYFPYDSADLTLEAQAQLDNLGAALASDEFRGAQWSIEGHTDAAGSALYNKSLSERRAASVQRYLVQQHGLPSAKLKPIGKGEAELFDAANPRASVNRRVRINYIGE